MGNNTNNKETRDCNNCIHHMSGMCNKWTCGPETLDQHDTKVREKAFDEVIAYCDHMTDKGIDKLDPKTIKEYFEKLKDMESKGFAKVN